MTHELIETYIRTINIGEGISPSTERLYRKDLRAFFSFLEGNLGRTATIKDIIELQVDDFMSFYDLAFAMMKQPTL